MNNNPLPGTVIAIHPGRQSGTLCLVIAGECEKLSYTLPEPVYEALGAPGKGDCLSDPALTAITEAAVRYRATETALHILGYGDNNRSTLCRKLVTRGISPTVARETADEMERCGYLREAEGAERQAALCATRKKWSRRKTFAFLVSHGYSGKVAETAIAAAEAAGDADFAGNRRCFIETKRRAGMTDDEIRRALYRAGF